MLSRVSLPCCVAYTSVRVSQTEQVAPQCPDGKIRYCDMIDFGKNTAFLSAQIHLFLRRLHTKTNVCNSQIGLHKVCVFAAHLTGNEDKQPALRSYSPLFRRLSEKNRRTAFDRSRRNVFGFKWKLQSSSSSDIWGLMICCVDTRHPPCNSIRPQ